MAPRTAAGGAAAAQTRDAARQLLGALLNGEWASRGAALLQPFGRRVRHRVATAAAAHGGAAPPRTVAALVALVAARWPQLPLPATTGPAEPLNLRAAAPPLRALAEPAFRRLRTAAQQLCRDHGVQCLLHGSLATDDWTAYRDADLLVLVPEALLASAARLDRLRRAMLPLQRALFAFDPLQHHGVFATSQDELRAWPEHWLPLATLRRAVDLGGAGTRLTVQPSFDRGLAQQNFAAAVAYFARARLPRDAYGWKAFASVLMLLPALHQAALGTPCWKGDSFARSAGAVAPVLWQPQVWAAAFRREFRDPTPRWVRQLLRCAPEPRLLQQVLRRLVHLPPHLRPEDGANLLRAARALAEALAEDVTRDTPP
jgi:hypothetical protein